MIWVNAQTLTTKCHACKSFTSQQICFLPVNNDFTHVQHREKSSNKKQSVIQTMIQDGEKGTRKRFEGTYNTRTHAIYTFIVSTRNNLKKEKWRVMECTKQMISCFHTAVAVLNKLPINSDEPYIANGNQHYYLHEGCTMVSIFN